YRHQARSRFRVEVLLDERCVDEGWPDRVDPNALGRILERRALGQSDHSVFGGDISGRIGEADGTEDRGHVDDGSASRFEHRRDLEAHPVEDPVQVDPDHLIPSVDRILASRSLGAADAGVVDGDVEAAVLVDSVLHHGFALLGSADVDGDEGGGCSRRRKLLGRPATVLLVVVGDHDRRATLGEGLGASPADSGGSSRHQRNLSFEVVAGHLSLPGRNSYQPMPRGAGRRLVASLSAISRQMTAQKIDLIRQHLLAHSRSYTWKWAIGYSTTSPRGALSPISLETGGVSRSRFPTHTSRGAETRRALSLGL